QTRTTAEAFATVLRSRRSIDLYEPTPVDPAVLLDAIDVARWAPNHKLTEPWRFYLVGPQTVAAIIELAAKIDTEKKGERAGESRALEGDPRLLRADEPAQRRRDPRARGLRRVLLRRGEPDALPLAARYRYQVGHRRSDARSAVLRAARYRCDEGNRRRLVLL